MTRRTHSDGYTLLEALVTLFIIAEILVAVLVLFDFNSRIGRTQSQISELQQTHRVAQSTLVRMLRSAGRGPLSRGNLPQGLAIEVLNNVAAGTQIAPGHPTSPLVLAGTDVLIMRGVFSNPMFLSPPDSDFVLANGSPGFVLMPFQALGLPAGSPIAQPPDAVIKAIQDGLPEAFLVASAEDSSRVQVYELNPANSSIANPDAVEVALDGLTNIGAYQSRMPVGFDIKNSLHAGILEEYRIFVQPPEGGLEIDGDGAGRKSPRLMMARVYPFTNIPHAGLEQNLSIELAENIFDLQLAFGIDLDRDGQIDEVLADLGDDEWLGNHVDDLLSPPVVAGTDWNTSPPGQRRAQLLFVRASTLAMTDRPDLSYEAPVYTVLEDHIYSADTPDVINNFFQRKFRRRVLQTLIDVRSL